MIKKTVVTNTTAYDIIMIPDSWQPAVRARTDQETIQNGALFESTTKQTSFETNVNFDLCHLAHFCIMHSFSPHFYAKQCIYFSSGVVTHIDVCAINNLKNAPEQRRM